MGLKEWITGTGMIFLFIIALIIFATTFIIANNPDQNNYAVSQMNNSLAGLTAKTQALQSAAENAKSLLSSETPSTVFLFLIILSAFTIPISFLAFLISAGLTIIGLPFTIFFGAGQSPYYLVFTVITGIIITVIVLTILKAIRLGQTER